MKVNQFNTFPYGGAATAAKRLHQQLLNREIESRFFYHLNDKQPPDANGFHQIEFATPPATLLSRIGGKHFEKRRRKKIHQQFDRHLKDHDSGGEVFAMAELPEPTPFNWANNSADIVHLHWISFLADYPSFFQSIPDDVPVVWTLHDMNPLTGGCHYSSGCTNFKTGCGNCPQIRDPGPRDLSHHSFQIKKRALKRKNVHVVTPSRWLGELAAQSPLFPGSTTFEVIRLGFDLDAFHPIDKLAARRKLGINSDACLIGFGAEDIRNKRKGFGHLLNALPQLGSATPVECIVFGGGEIPGDIAGLPTVHHQGFVDSIETQSLIYSAADLVVVPSREDNQPQVGLEAMACGTPVVGFDAGGIPEYVRADETGLLASPGNEQELASAIRQLVESPELRERMGAAARKMMESEFEIAAQSEKYLQLYRRICGKKASTIQPVAA